jgi:transcription elongation GreA/GreB family factor
MLSLRFRDLSRIKEQATIVSVTADSTTVRIGKRIRVRETTSDTQIKIKIGSFRTFSDDEETVSYSSPVAKIIIGAKIGEIRHGTVDKKQVTYVVEGIE